MQDASLKRGGYSPSNQDFRLWFIVSRYMEQFFPVILNGVIQLVKTKAAPCRQQTRNHQLRIHTLHILLFNRQEKLWIHLS